MRPPSRLRYSRLWDLFPDTSDEEDFRSNESRSTFSAQSQQNATLLQSDDSSGEPEERDHWEDIDYFEDDMLHYRDYGEMENIGTVDHLDSDPGRRNEELGENGIAELGLDGEQGNNASEKSEGHSSEESEGYSSNEDDLSQRFAGSKPSKIFRVVKKVLRILSKEKQLSCQPPFLQAQ